MLYLLQKVEPLAEGAPQRVPISVATAHRLERALLTTDCASRRSELLASLAEDRNMAAWTMRAAELRLSRTINRPEEAADWLCERLEIELATALVGEDSPAPMNDIEWRLPSLVEKLANVERKLGDFQTRLEREKLESLKELAYGASHEINNPLANIAARAQTLLDDEENPERRRKLSAIHRQAMRAHEMIADLMLFARPPKLELAMCDLDRLVRRVVDEFTELTQEYDVELTCDSERGNIELPVDATQLGVAIHAVVLNSLEAVSSGGQVAVTVRERDIGAQRFAEVVVRDNGPGISDEVRRHMFDPFYSGREAGRGLGFGLSKCWRIVTDHGGRVIVQQRSGGGAEITLLLPMATLAANHP